MRRSSRLSAIRSSAASRIAWLSLRVRSARSMVSRRSESSGTSAGYAGDEAVVATAVVAPPHFGQTYRVRSCP